MAGDQKNTTGGFGGGKMSDAYGMDQGAGGIRSSGASQFGQPAAMQFRGPTMINMFCHPGSYSVTTHFGGNLARTFGTNMNPNSSGHVKFAGDTRYSASHNPSTRMPREATPYPHRGQSPTAIVPQAESPKYFQP